MKTAVLNIDRWFAPGSRAYFSGIVRSHARVFSAVIAVGAMLGMSLSARAETYYFSVNGSGIHASGAIQVSDAGSLGVLGGSTVTGISGTFTDSTNGISGAITGLEFAPSPTFNVSPPAPPNTFGPPAATDAGFSYDNLFWVGGDSPAVCQDALVFLGGDFDVYGMAFDVAGGYTADLWSDGALGGYQLNDSYKGVPFYTKTSDTDPGAYAVNVSTSTTPEPGSLLLVGTGMSGIAALWRRRKTAA